MIRFFQAGCSGYGLSCFANSPTALAIACISDHFIPGFVLSDAMPELSVSHRIALQIKF
jgi:hypothetical protein